MPRRPASRRIASAARRTEGEAPNGAIDYGPLANWLGFHLRMAQAASFQAFARQTHGLAVAPGRFATLMLIDRNPGISQTALSRANGRDKSSLTPVLDDLARRGFIRRQRTREDRRAYRLTLTPSGEKLLRQLTACAKRHDRNLDRIVGRRDRTRLLALLRKITAEIA
jgi:DNA-binding MarR family transcriptional regulator